MATTELGLTQMMLAEATRFYGGLPLRIGDCLSKHWLNRLRSPYKDEIAAISEVLGQPGTTAMNLSYEWGCTSGVGPDPVARGNRLLRTLDWSLTGLGRHAVVAAHETSCGAYYNVTWPGYVGVLTAMAPKRFSAAINQPPAWKMTRSRRVDWVISHLNQLSRDGWPPPHLLRTVFETCQTFASAREMLVTAPICTPAFFILSGTEPDESCVIERLPTRAAVHDGPFSIANHWLDIAARGRETCPESHSRRASMQAIRDQTADDFSWVSPPILSPVTRLAVIASAERGTLLVQGWEDGMPATDVFNLRERHPCERS
ncbi:MAG: hypothetical protein H6905_08820 [Hyphomicrobiales bacterium]|nr:hypothetical protein [Hyphomicrobiales bacterium]